MKKFNWRTLTSEDLPILEKWWEDWNWPDCPTIDMLPRNAFLVYNAQTEMPVYAGFLYETGTAIGWVEYVVSSKTASIEDKRGGLEYLFEVISVIAKWKGITALFTSTLNDGFIQSLKKNGFEIGDTGMTQLVKKL